MKLKFLFFGIDGASHHLTQQYIREGRMPALKSLSDNGASGLLNATFPPHTGPGWVSMFTGVTPGEHGIYQFWKTQQTDYQAKTIGFKDTRWQPLWKILERHGLRVGVINMPMTHPPIPLKNGFMISWPLSPTIHYTYPKEIVSELANANLHYQSDLMLMFRGQDDYPELMKKSIQQRTESIFYLLDKYPVDALFVVYSEVDRVSHYYWGNQSSPTKTVADIYEATDQALSKLLSLTNKDTLITVASDHGFGHCRYNFHIHPFLEKHGLLHTKYTPLPTGQKQYEDDLNWFSSRTAYKKSIDWTKTKVYMPTAGCFGLNINLKGREKEGSVEPSEIKDIETILTSIINENISDPINNKPVFELKKADEIYFGDAVGLAPDYLLYPKQWDIMPHPDLDQSIWGIPTQQAIHRMDGIFYANHSSINHQEQLLLCNIESVTPFILNQLDLPLSKGMSEDTIIQSNKPIRFETPQRQTTTDSNTLSEKEEDALKQRFADLGYM